ncbi:MAG: LacI family DNA-binding transcriptional regulator [Butyricicoccus pullicaecorum]|nr:LacI family DNA-binding transcriptional regulator [Butyricicoccus pullicaecorum]MBS5151313.1 LacI family DNA-binding transcriptional regulator [Butyricicoccus pullicaecorum]
MSVTLKQIAEMAGVHKSTVDKVIHNRPGVSTQTRQRIKQLLEEQGYESNPLAKALNYQKKKLTVAVVLPQVDALGEIKKGIELLRPDCTSFNIDIVYHQIPYSNAKAQADCLYELQKNGVSGVIVSPLEDEAVQDAINNLAEHHIPVVMLNSDIEDGQRICFVGRNELQAGRVAGRLMGLLLGQSGSIGVLTSTLHAVKQREKGFTEYLSQHFPEISISYVGDTLEDPYRAYHLTCEVMEQACAPDGLFIACGCVADICKAVRDCGKVGQVMIVCFERYPIIVKLVQSGEVACTISGDLTGQGQSAMRILFEYLIYDKMPQADEVYLQNEILLPENI